VRKHRSYIDPRTAVALLVIGFLAGAILGPVDYGVGQTYRFDRSLPQNQQQLENVAADIKAIMGTERDQENGVWTVYFLDDHAFKNRFERADRNPQAWWSSSDESIYFNARFYPSPFTIRFTIILAHELGHAWGLEHSPDENSIMYWAYKTGQQFLLADRFALWMAQQNQRRTNAR